MDERTKAIDAPLCRRAIAELTAIDAGREPFAQISAQESRLRSANLPLLTRLTSIAAAPLAASVVTVVAPAPLGNVARVTRSAMNANATSAPMRLRGAPTDLGMSAASETMS